MTPPRLNRRRLLGGVALATLSLTGTRPWQAWAGEPAGPATYPRRATAVGERVIHSGHSLTDSYLGALTPVYQSRYPAGRWDDHVKSTVPGSSTSLRWNMADGDFYTNPRNIMDQSAELMMTERGLDGLGVATPDNYAEIFHDDLLHQLKFASMAVGLGLDVSLWSIWPGMEIPGWEAMLLDYEDRHKLRADYLTWKLQQLHPGWDGRVWICPGHRMIEALRRQQPPGVRRFEDLFSDSIHPDQVLIYGLSCLVTTFLYQTNLAAEAPELVLYQDVTQAQSDFLKALAWRIVTDYEPAGMGGSEGAEQVWSGHDWYPHVTTLAELDAAAPETAVPEPWFDWRAPAEDLPEIALLWTADGYEGPPLQGPEPRVRNGLLQFDGDAAPLRGKLPVAGDRYGIMAVRVPAGQTSQDRTPIVAHVDAAAEVGNWWEGPNHVLLNRHGRWFEASLDDGTACEYEAGKWHILEWRHVGRVAEVILNGQSQSLAGGRTRATDDIMLFGTFDTPGMDLEVAALALVSRDPTPAERQALLAMVYARMPK